VSSLEHDAGRFIDPSKIGLIGTIPGISVADLPKIAEGEKK
jgi:hypothetical protein